jgi:hypothetical protein
MAAAAEALDAVATRRSRGTSGGDCKGREKERGRVDLSARERFWRKQKGRRDPARGIRPDSEARSLAGCGERKEGDGEGNRLFAKYKDCWKTLLLCFFYILEKENE